MTRIMASAFNLRRRLGRREEEEGIVRVRCGDVPAARRIVHRRGYRHEAAGRVHRRDPEQALAARYAQLGAGEQVVQRRGVER